MYRRSLSWVAIEVDSSPLGDCENRERIREVDELLRRAAANPTPPLRPAVATDHEQLALTPACHAGRCLYYICADQQIKIAFLTVLGERRPGRLLEPAPFPLRRGHGQHDRSCPNTAAQFHGQRQRVLVLLPALVEDQHSRQRTFPYVGANQCRYRLLEHVPDQCLPFGYPRPMAEDEQVIRVQVLTEGVRRILFHGRQSQLHSPLRTDCCARARYGGELIRGGNVQLRRTARLRILKLCWPVSGRVECREHPGMDGQAEVPCPFQRIGKRALQRRTVIKQYDETTKNGTILFETLRKTTHCRSKYCASPISGHGLRRKLMPFKEIRSAPRATISFCGRRSGCMDDAHLTLAVSVYSLPGRIEFKRSESALAEADRQGEGAMQIRTILYPIDLSDRTHDALAYAVKMAHDWGARLLLLHVAKALRADNLSHGGDAPLQPMSDEQRLGDDLRHIQVPDPNLQVEYLLSQGDPVKAILHTATERDCDLIVLGGPSRRGLRRFLERSLAEQVVREATCPVLVVKASPKPQQPSHTAASQSML